MNIRKNIPLAQYTTFKIGGPAKFFCEAAQEEEILEALKFAKEKSFPVFILGGGSNVLVSDKGFDGLVIKISNFKFRISNLRIICDGGLSLGKAVSESVKAGLTGIEWAAGIPGTVGGAVRGNAGAKALGGEMSDNIDSVRVLNVADLQFKDYDSEMCGYEYRNSIFKQNPNLIILSANLKLKKGDKAESEKKIKEILAKRKEKQPMEFPSPGSFFKNPLVKDKNLIKQFETDTGQKIRDSKIPAPWLIEEAGMKGEKIGEAMVSEKHANFIVNIGGATAEDVVMLAAVIKTRVRNKFGIQLQEEVQMVGF
jgi:UDP-N-acetylmuramate dehydrogenase